MPLYIGTTTVTAKQAVDLINKAQTRKRRAPASEAMRYDRERRNIARRMLLQALSDIPGAAKVTVPLEALV